MKNNKLITLSFRKIKKSYKRFFSLVVLSLLGVSFFVGMRVSMPNLLTSLDNYYKEKNVFDVEILSTNGLNKEDLKAISNLDNNITVYGLRFKDVLFNDKNSNSDVIRINEYNDNINKISLLKGRLPKNKNEILIDEKYLLVKNAKVGDTLDLVIEKDDEDLNVNKVKIVGIINSPIYLTTNEGSLNRGNTLIGNGEIKYYAYAPSSIFNMDYYTEIYIDSSKTNNDVTNSDIYNKKVDKIIDKIDSIKDERIKYRYEEIREIALSKIKHEEDKVYKEINDAKDKLNNAKVQIDNVGSELENKKKQLDSANYQLNIKKNEINNIESKINTGQVELENKKKQLDSTKNSISNYDTLLTVARKNQSNTLTKNDIISILPDDGEKQANIEKLNLAESAGANFSSLSIIIKQINDLGIDPQGTTTAKINNLQQNLNNILQIENGYSLYNSKINELNNYKNTLENAKKIYSSYLNQYNYGNSQYIDAKSKFDEELNKYNSAVNELNEKEITAKNEFDKARKKVDETIVPGTWMIRSRLDNVDYAGFIDSIESLKNLAFIFPIIFFVVSIFISLLSMTRMGIEDRSEMGTLKAFGFSKKEILFQYIFYSLLATLIGSIFGIIMGTIVFPRIIFDVYTNLYALPKMVYGDFSYTLIIGILISIACIVGSTIISIMSILKESTIDLLRPIAPMIGKKILLEKIPFIWNKMTFENKITARNIFRYKKRILMTLTGIVSCTMILISAFLIRDSITTVLDIQFKEIFTYDSMIYLDGSKLTYELDDIFNIDHVNDKVYADLQRVKIDNTSINLLVPNNVNDFDKVIKLKDENGKLKINDDGVIITSKLAKMYNYKVNDKIKIKAPDNKEYKLKINAITENYIGNYIYMSKKAYQDKIGLYKINIAYIKLDNANNEKIVIENLLNDNKNILSYLSISNSVSSVKNMFTSLDKVVLVVVIFSLLLSIVVLYSLAYIIISERQREISTLKVLGFDDQEVDIYLLKEQAIIVLIGIILGLIIGIFYSLILVDTLEIRMVQFNKDLLFRNYIVAMLLMLAFTTIVGQLIHFRLKKIDMIESLKKVE